MTNVTNTHCELAKLIATNEKQAPAAVAQRQMACSNGEHHIILKDIPKVSQRDAIECLLQVHKPHEEWLDKLPHILKYP